MIAVEPAKSVPVPRSNRGLTARARERLPAHAISLAVTAGFLVLVGSRARSLGTELLAHWPELVTWLLLITVIEFFPIRVNDATLTIDLPLLLAVAILHSPEVAGTVAFLSALDSREIRSPKVGLSRALFNRSQIALSVLAAGHVFHVVSPGLQPLWKALLGVVFALAADYVVNVVLASLHMAARRGSAWSEVISQLTVGGTPQFLATYLGYGVLGIAIAFLSREVGPWSVSLFLIPALVARQALVREQRLAGLASELRNQERLVERALDRIVDERRDERLRIAGDLHDDVLQSLTHVWMTSRLLGNGADGDHDAGLDDLTAYSDRSIQALREVIHDLRESPLGRGGLIPTLAGLVRDLRLDWQAEIRCRVPDRVDAQAHTQVLVYQVAREGLMNALKHAHASRIGITLTEDGGWLRLEIEDDGTGFDPAEVDRSAQFGLGLMEERVKRLRGQVSIDTGKGNGTRLVATFPAEPRPEP